MTTARQIRIAQAMDKLKQWQPGAKNIQLLKSSCTECRGNRYLTYWIPVCSDGPPEDETIERCGYYCPDCGFGTAGARKRT